MVVSLSGAALAPQPGAGGLSRSKAGIGLRGPHVMEVLEQRPSVPWFEVHTENYFAPFHRARLERVAADYPLSFHGVGLSLGSAHGIDAKHLGRVQELVAAFQPALVSEHASWSAIPARHHADLLPLPYTDEALDVLARNVDTVQQRLGRQVLVENPSTYLAWTDSHMREVEFLNVLVARTGCGLLLDINNIFVQAHNVGLDAASYLVEVDAAAVGEYHLAGHVVQEGEDSSILVDTHSRPVAEAVWRLFERALEHVGPRPTLIEWDSDLPSLDQLLAEASAASSRMNKTCA